MELIIKGEDMSSFETLSKVNVNDHTEKKNGLTYLSWPWAVSEIGKAYPDFTFEVKKFDGLPYVYDERTGYMVYTEMTINGITREMWLPVMDGANKAMKSEPYSYKTKYGDKYVEAATMFDINKTIMRCLVKNAAMFGLGLYIYAGEDLPEEEQIPLPDKEVAQKKTANYNNDCIDDEMLKKLESEIKRTGLDLPAYLKMQKVSSLKELSKVKAQTLLNKLENK